MDNKQKADFEAQDSYKKLKSKRYRIIISEDNTYSTTVEANSEDEARDIVLSGDCDFKLEDTLDTQILDIKELQ